MYLWRDSRLGRDSDNEFTHIDGGIHIKSSRISIRGLR